MDWDKAKVSVTVLLVGGVPATLEFQQVTGADLPRVQPWGPSSSINEVKQSSEGEYALEMQSGDNLRVKAASWSFSITTSQGEA